MSSWLDHLPSQEKEKIRKRMRSPEEYERLREKVKGPEDLEREMEKNAEFAEAKLSLESDRGAQEKAKNIIKNSQKEQGTEASIDRPSERAKEKIEKGAFEVIVSSQDQEPSLAIKILGTPNSAPSGNVSEVFPLKPALQKQILATFTLQ